MKLSGQVNAEGTAPTKTDVFIEQIIDSLIVAGIAGLSALPVSFYFGDPFAAAYSAGLAFGMTFLVKLKEYRGIT
jgi:hypothetical protein